MFKLGTKYSQTFRATFQDSSGAQVPMVMGCYGIGVNRIVASVIEQRHDANGLIWPPAIAPFDVVITVLAVTDAAARKAGEEAYERLRQTGHEVLLDDREQSPGSKLKDADLIGIPVQVVIGKVWATAHRLEVIERASKARQEVEEADLVEAIDKFLDKP